MPQTISANAVIRDIKSIGIVNIIKWLIVMAILLNAITFISSFVMSIPYVGFLIYGCIVIPIIESIANYSLGLLYSNIAKSYDDSNFDQIEKENTNSYILKTDDNEKFIMYVEKEKELEELRDRNNPSLSTVLKEINSINIVKKIYK